MRTQMLMVHLVVEEIHLKNTLPYVDTLLTAKHSVEVRVRHKLFSEDKDGLEHAGSSP
jgi:hypothetical protein